VALFSEQMTIDPCKPLEFLFQGFENDGFLQAINKKQNGRSLRNFE
jgi:hypothetical protein